MMQLSARSRTTSISYSFQPSRLSSIRTLTNGGGFNPGTDDMLKLFAVIGDAAPSAAEGESRADNGGQADIFNMLHGFGKTGGAVIARNTVVFVTDFRRRSDGGARVFQPDGVHRLAETLPVFGLVDHIGLRTDHLHIVFFEDARFFQIERAVQCCLPAHGGEKGVRPFLLDDLLDKFRRNRLDIGGVGEAGVGHDGCRVRVHQNDPVAFLLQGLAGLNAGIVELAGLADDNGAGADDEDGGNVVTFWH